MEKTTVKKVKKHKNDNKLILTIIFVIIISLLTFIGFQNSLFTNQTFRIGYFTMLAGLVVENLRISEKYLNVVYYLTVAFILSLGGFFLNKNGQEYSFQNHIDSFPIVFLWIFMVITTIVNFSNAISKLTEGITLLLSVSFIYWVFDYGIFNMSSFLIKGMVIISLIICLFVLLNALTNIKLSKVFKLILSVWSIVIMLLIGIDNIRKTSQNELIENIDDSTYAFSIGVQFFTLGISSVYMTQYVLMIFSLLYREGRQLHIERYSNTQVKISHSLFFILILSFSFWLNYTYNFLPRNTAIWIGITLFPLMYNIVQFKRYRVRAIQ